MSTSNSTFNERVAVVGVVDPDAYTASGSYDKTTDAIDMSKWNRVAFIVMAGDVEDTGTIDFKVTESDMSGGSYTDVADKAITQLTTDDDDKQAIIEVTAADLTDDNRYVRGELRTATAASDVSVVALGLDARNEPAGAGNLASVAEVVA